MPAWNHRVFVQLYEGEQLAMAPFTTALLFRYNIRAPPPGNKTPAPVPEDRSGTPPPDEPLVPRDPLLWSAVLSISTEALRSATCFMVIDNDTNVVTAYPSFQTGPMLFAQNVSGYCLIALVEAGPQGTKDGVWCLTLTASIPPAECTATLVSKLIVLEGTYNPNVRSIVSRHVITSTAPLQLAVQATTKPPLPFRLTISPTAAGELQWMDSFTPAAVEADAPEGRAVMPNMVLAPGRYMVQIVLDGPTCPEGWQPEPSTGTIVAGPVAYRLVLIPGGDERTVTVAPDESRLRYFRAMAEAWNNIPVPGPKVGIAKAGVKAPLRGLTAITAFEKYTAALAAGESVTPMTRTLKDGTVLALTPDAYLRRLAASAAPTLLTATELEDRRVAVEAASAAAGPAGLGAMTASREAAKGARVTQVADQVTTLGDLRSARLLLQQGIATRRAEMMQLVKAPPGAVLPPVVPVATA